MPYHVLLDTAGEAQLGKLQIGTTRRGIGPCYADKSARLGIRVQDLLDEKILRKKIMAAMEPKRQLLRPHAKDPALDLHAMTEEYVTYGHRLEPHIADTAQLCWDALDAGRSVLFEGAQGALLDLDHGTYPFVTSSNPVAGAACVGAGVGPTRHRRGLGNHQGLRDPGRRRARSRPSSTTRSATTCASAATSSAPRPAAPRRCGWLDLVALRYAVAPQRADRPRDHQARRALRASTRCGSRSATAARRARSSTSSPTTSRSCTTPTAEYEELPGLGGGHHRRAAPIDDLPQAARDYLDYIAEFAGVPVTLVGVGPGRDQVIWATAAAEKASLEAA